MSIKNATFTKGYSKTMLKESEQKQIKKMFEEIDKHNGNIKEAALSCQKTIPDFVLEKMKQVERYFNHCEEFEGEIKIDNSEFNNDNGLITITVSIPYTWCEYDYPCDMSSKEITANLLSDIENSLECMRSDISDYISDVRRNIDYLKMMR